MQHARRIEVGGTQCGHEARQVRRRDEQERNTGEGGGIGIADAEDEPRQEPARLNIVAGEVSINLGSV